VGILALKRSILFVVNVDWFFESHRLSLAERAISDGYSVHIACKNTGRLEFFKNLGIQTHNLNFTRSKQSILQNIFTLIGLLRIILVVRPDICHFITIKPIVFGGLLSLISRKQVSIFAVTGLGSSFLNNGWKARLRSRLLLRFYKYIFMQSKAFTIFQNMADLNLVFQGRDIPYNKIKLIPGCGVDLTKYVAEQDWNAEQLKVVMAARILKDKGVREYFEMARIISAKYGEKIEFNYFGNYDIDNPSSISVNELNALNQDNSVKIHEFSLELHEVLSKTHIIVLPSYREGFPKVIMEGSASGCVAIVSNVPGCSDAVVDGITGFLTLKASVSSLIDAVDYCLQNRNHLLVITKNARTHAEKYFGITQLVDEHMEVYKRVLSHI
jgi:glycosyltransferase involved in cell wall biosynthesis